MDRSGLLQLLVCALFASALSDAISGDFVFSEGLVVGSAGRSGRNAFHTDSVEQAMISGAWHPPQAGEEFAGPGGTNRTWRAATADKDGVFSGGELRGGYLYTTYVTESPGVYVLQAEGHNMVYANGEPRPGDPYSNGTLELPVKVHQGTNEFLFNVGRGRLKARLTSPKSPIFVSLRDNTLPDLIRGDAAEVWGAVVVINTQDELANDLVLSTACAGGEAVETKLPAVPPLSARKVPVLFRAPEAPEGSNTVGCALSLRHGSGSGEALDHGTITLRVRRSTDHYKQTFRSDIDGSIQYYAVAPPNPEPPLGSSPALFLSTHGAGVEGMGQADAYASKSWGYLVAPTNRRPYGFDWEDWGRGDAIEVLNLVQSKFNTDPAQTYLTGHSMGGHGAWQLGVTFPDRFAAVAPSAGWISFWSYGGAKRNENPDPVENIIQRASTGSDTLALASNYLQHAIYVLHGDADDNVPVSEGRKMKERLGEFHHDFVYHEQPGAGHWWGNACVDWPPIFDLFSRHRIPNDGALSEIRFSTANPGVSATNHWLVIEQQKRGLARSTVDILYNPQARKFTGSTENVVRLALRTTEIAPLGVSFVELDGDKIEVPPELARAAVLRLKWEDNRWGMAAELEPGQKGPKRSGPFKEAFNHRMIFVYGTHGTPEENAWAYGKARFDAESWWYRGNGAVDVVSDNEFELGVEPDRGIVLYGNSDNNGAWPALLANSPVQVSRSSIKVGDKEVTGGDLACLFTRPRPGSDIASIAVVSGTGLIGLRLTERVPYFLAGIGYPDCTVFGLNTLTEGVKGVRVAGFFGNDWSVEQGEFAWGESKPAAAKVEGDSGR